MPRTMVFSILAAMSALCMAAGSESLPPLSIDLGPENRANGLTVPSAGDGCNEPIQAGGQWARRIAGEGSNFLYVRVDHAAYAKGPRDLYLMIEAYDESFAFVQVQYDKSDPQPSLSSKYTKASEQAILTGAGKWRTLCFFLPQVRMGHGQNLGADFRFQLGDAPVRRITVAAERPEGFQPSAGIDEESLAALRVRRAAGMELTFGNDATAAQAALFKALSVTSVESYVDWAGVEPEREGRWDWSKCDEQTATLDKAGLKWVPFLIAGPAYATPLWFQNGPDSHFYKCLEHGQASRVQSLFNPELRRHVGRFFQAFAQCYRDRGVIESLLLGVTGIFGESIYPAGDADGGWTARLTGPYHNHKGWWAGDELAIAAFRKAMGAKYGAVERLNATWGTRFASLENVATFLPDRAPSEQARADFVEWYQQAMTDWAVFWVATARQHFPATEIYLCTGGNGDPILGADFTAQAKAIAPHGAGIRITNEGSDYAANFIRVREAATATAFYGTFVGFEPAGKVDARGNVARIYNATATGALQLHCYDNNPLQSGEALAEFRENARFLTPRQPRVDIAFYVSRETLAVDPGAIDRMYRHATRLRDLADYAMVTRQSVADGTLRGRRALIMVECAALDSAAAKAIEEWTRGGGVLILASRTDETPASRLTDLREWRERLLAPAAKAEGRSAASSTAEEMPAAAGIKQVGKGWSVYLEGTADNPDDLAQALASLMRETDKRLPGIAPLAPLDGRMDRRYTTRFADGSALWFDVKTATIEASPPAR